MQYFKQNIRDNVTTERAVIGHLMRLYLVFTGFLLVVQLLNLVLIILHSVIFHVKIENLLTYSSIVDSVFIIIIMISVRRFVLNNQFLSRNFIVMWIFLGILVLLSSVDIYYVVVTGQNMVVVTQAFNKLKDNRSLLPRNFFVKYTHHLKIELSFMAISLIASWGVLLLVIAHNFISIRFFNLLYTFNYYCFDRNRVRPSYSRVHLINKVVNTLYFRFKIFQSLKRIKPFVNLEYGDLMLKRSWRQRLIFWKKCEFDF